MLLVKPSPQWILYCHQTVTCEGGKEAFTSPKNVTSTHSCLSARASGQEAHGHLKIPVKMNTQKQF